MIAASATDQVRLSIGHHRRPSAGPAALLLRSEVLTMDWTVSRLTGGRGATRHAATVLAMVETGDPRLTACLADELQRGIMPLVPAAMDHPGLIRDAFTRVVGERADDASVALAIIAWPRCRVTAIGGGRIAIQRLRRVNVMEPQAEAHIRTRSLELLRGDWLVMLAPATADALHLGAIGIATGRHAVAAEVCRALVDRA
ncbi:MAG: hypothetical protein H0X38_18845, partial [Planctomycetes bacterium]|nr:hypothetical protein [Planctomycetota bacterium]